MGNSVRLSISDSLAVVTLDAPGEKVNALSTPVMAELGALAEKLAAANGIRALLLRSGKPGSFIVGADVKEVAAIPDAEDGRRKSALGQEIFSRWAALPFPTVAAIHGTCLGGGTELALACDFRVASDSPRTRLGLPEVQLGILPGWGGTQRLPRTVGIAAALDLILTGKQLDARRARKIGLVDEVVPEAIFEEWSETFARSKFGAKKRRRLARRKTLPEKLLESNPAGRALVFRKARQSVLAKTGGHYPAPLEALAAVREGIGRSLPRGLAAENAHFARLIATPVQRNLLRLFFATEEVKRENGARNPTVEARPVSRIGVLGAGVMGGGIAQLAADRGLAVRLKDVNAEALARGFATAAELWREKVKRRRLSPRDFRAKMALLSGGLDYAGFAGSDVTVEAVVEKLDVKRAVLREWEAAVPEDRIFASNTSTLPITQIAEGARAPRRVVGLHFFNPVHRMPLVEVIRGERTSDETIATVFALARAMGKTPVVVRDAPGFLVNRLLAPYVSEALRLLEDGCRIEAIDEAMTAFGMPVGPLALLDDVGLDVAAKAGHVMSQAFPERLPESESFGRLVDSGRLGRKAHRGFYEYRDGHREGPDRRVYRELKLARTSRPKLPAEVIESRLLLPMINEAAWCLEDQIVGSAAKLDLAMIFGTGFPAFRGGPLRHADAIGIDRIVARLEDLEERLGPRFAPCARLRRMAADGTRFYPEN